MTASGRIVLGIGAGLALCALAAWGVAQAVPESREQRPTPAGDEGPGEAPATSEGIGMDDLRFANLADRRRADAQATADAQAGCSWDPEVRSLCDEESYPESDLE